MRTLTSPNELYLEGKGQRNSQGKALQSVYLAIQ